MNIKIKVKDINDIVKMNLFDKEIYDFLFNTYSQNKNKAETIKLGMNKFNMDIKKTKEIVDYISEEI